jgi:hypothetical protein
VGLKRRKMEKMENNFVDAEHRRLGNVTCEFVVALRNRSTFWVRAKADWTVCTVVVGLAFVTCDLIQIELR